MNDALQNRIDAIDKQLGELPPSDKSRQQLLDQKLALFAHAPPAHAQTLAARLDTAKREWDSEADADDIREFLKEEMPWSMRTAMHDRLELHYAQKGAKR